MEEEKQQTVSADDKKPYEKPVALELGSLESMTQFSTSGGNGSQVVILSCDRNLKENFASVDVSAVLEKLACIRVSTWNYKTDSKDVRHMGPMAQDFAKAFGMGESDRVIHSVDSAGVTMAAVQALYKMVLDQNERIAALEAGVREAQSVALAV